MTNTAQEDRVERLHDWFDLQLLLVESLVHRTGLAFNDAVTHYTNLHKRLGFGRPVPGAASAEWSNFLQSLSQAASRKGRLIMIKEFGRRRFVSDAPKDRLEFGCFNFDPPNDRGVIKLHFAANDTLGGCGPLARAKADQRRQELREMFHWIRKEYEFEARQVAGASWLYNLPAYQRLFPVEFVDSCSTYKSETMRLVGLSQWGQFLDHRQRIKPQLRQQFLLNLEELDLAALWRLFPLPALTARAPISVFYEFYSVQPQGQ